jgi:hypothetical protein
MGPIAGATNPPLVWHPAIETTPKKTSEPDRFNPAGLAL